MKKLMGIGASLILAGTFFYMVFASPHIPLLDANRQILAESVQDALCAGETFAATRGDGSKELAHTCRTETYPEAATERDLEIVQKTFCVAFSSKTGYPVDECETVLKSLQYWPTKDGAITSSWNRAFPYPLENNLSDIEQQSNSRTGDRENNDREGMYRP